MIGWAYFKAGRTEDGLHTLERALAIPSFDRNVRYHLGQVYEQLAVKADGGGEAVTAWLDQAEDSYIAGFGASRGENLNETALQALYRAPQREPRGDRGMPCDARRTGPNSAARAHLGVTSGSRRGEGYVQFVQIGGALMLDREFSWRVEALRKDAGSH